MREYYVGRDIKSTKICIMSPQNMTGKSALQNGSPSPRSHRRCKIGGTRRTSFGSIIGWGPGEDEAGLSATEGGAIPSLFLFGEMMGKQKWSLGTRRRVWVVAAAAGGLIIAASAATGSLPNTASAVVGTIISMTVATVFLWPLGDDSG